MVNNRSHNANAQQEGFAYDASVEETEQPLAARQDPPGPNESAAERPRVLLADDDTIVLELVGLFLAADGHTVTRVSGGQEAFNVLRGVSPLPDVVLVDHQMPDISGTDVAIHVRSLPDPRPRIIAMSASPLPPDELAHFDGFLPKPVDQDQLRTMLNGASKIDGHHATESATSAAALDAAVVRRLRAIMPPHAIQELYTAYVNDTRQRINELERCVGLEDEEGLRRCAHALKGAAAMTGVRAVATIAAGFEEGVLPAEEHARLFRDLRAACDDVERSMASSAVSGEAR